jgi:hypothetical protein
MDFFGANHGSLCGVVMALDVGTSVSHHTYSNLESESYRFIITVNGVERRAKKPAYRTSWKEFDTLTV